MIYKPISFRTILRWNCDTNFCEWTTDCKSSCTKKIYAKKI